MNEQNHVTSQPIEDAESQQQENVILRDWFSFTSKKHTPEELIEAMGLADCPWQQAERGAHGYKDRLYYGCISVHYNGREDMGVWVELTGQGCRAFEDHTKLPNKWDDLTKFVLENDLHITRFDVAFDDHTGVLDMKTIQDAIEAQRYVSPSNFWETIRSSEGQSAYIGSPKSLIRIRIYDKAAERGYTDGRHWNRVELQLRDERADKFIRLTVKAPTKKAGEPMKPVSVAQPTYKGTGEVAEDLTLGQAFSGVLLNYLRIVEPSETDSNKSRWQMTDYWASILEEVGKISLWSAPGGAYNLARCNRYVFDYAGNAVDCLIDVYGVKEFLDRINTRKCKPNPKYELIKLQQHQLQEVWAEQAAKNLELMPDHDEWAYSITERAGKAWEDY